MKKILQRLYDYYQESKGWRLLELMDEVIDRRDRDPYHDPKKFYAAYWSQKRDARREFDQDRLQRTASDMTLQHYLGYQERAKRVPISEVYNNMRGSTFKNARPSFSEHHIVKEYYERKWKGMSNSMLAMQDKAVYAMHKMRVSAMIARINTSNELQMDDCKDL